MIRTLLWALLLAAGYAVGAGCGDVTGDVIVPATSEPLVCGSDEECAQPTPRCDTVVGECVACLGDGDCTDGNVCALPANVCAERCAPESCDGLRPVCGGNGLCRACSSDAECPIQAPLCLGTGACVQCLEHIDCLEEEFDEPLLCDPAGRCVECLDDGDCYEFGERCSIFLGRCVEPCSATEPCRADDPVCDASIGFCVECSDDDDCEPGARCRASYCSDE